MSTNRRLGVTGLVLIAIAIITPMVLAQGPIAEKEKKLGDLWADFLHGVKVARPDLAKSNGQAILDSGAPCQPEP